MSALTPGAPPSQAPHQGLAAPGASPLPFVGVAVGQARQGWRGLPGWWPRQGQGIGAGLSSRGVLPAWTRGLRPDTALLPQPVSVSEGLRGVCHTGVCVALQSCPTEGRGLLCTCGVGALRCWSQSFCPSSKNAALGQTLLLEALLPLGAGQARPSRAVVPGKPAGLGDRAAASPSLTLSLVSRAGAGFLRHTHCSGGPAYPGVPQCQLLFLGRCFVCMMQTGSECELSSRGRETPPLVPLPSFPGVMVADGSVTSFLTGSWLRLALAQQVLAVGQWLPDSEVHQDSGQQSDLGRDLRLSQVLRVSGAHLLSRSRGGRLYRGLEPSSPGVAGSCQAGRGG